MTNFDKSTLVPINLDNEDQMQISYILGCPIASFPQTYLGIPLSDSKLPRCALYPLLHSLDKKVDSLSLSGATSGGRLTLSKSVFSALPSHILACIKAPIWFYQEIDKRRCAYFWSGQKTTTGARCRIAWDAVCRPIEEGGLNIINLETQNICLLLKFIHKLHMPNKSSWANWILSFVYSGQKRLGDKISRCSSSWRYLMTLIDLYRNLTIVKIGDGKSTCFWLDSWLGNKPLSVQFPALFSHVQSPNVLVADCCTDNGWMLRFRHITSNRAQEELGLLLDRLNLVSLSEEPDRRFMRFGPNKNFSVKSCYYALNFGGVSCVGNQEIWNSFAPK
jgi:hypothetical protein